MNNNGQSSHLGRELSSWLSEKMVVCLLLAWTLCSVAAETISEGKFHSHSHLRDAVTMKNIVITQWEY